MSAHLSFLSSFAGAPLVLATLLMSIGLAMRFLKQRFPENPTPLIDRVDACLPQTQCAQCGYPGCRPYAEAVVNADAALNLCPPGGEATYRALTDLMGTTDAPAPLAPMRQTVVINEAECIGCTLCLPPCPVDAIAGAQGQMHTVISSQCTGCELCIPACPVDCIDLIPLPEPVTFTPRRKPRPAEPERACINCTACNTACPVLLPAEQLLHLVRQTDLPRAEQLGLSRCIECGLCDRVCPSNIALAEEFGAAKQLQAKTLAEFAEQARLKQRYSEHTSRQTANAEQGRAKRNARLAGKRSWT